MPGIINPFLVAPATSYVGPGDVQSGAISYIGVRAYTLAQALAHANAFDLVRVSDGATMTATYLDSGDLDVATISAWTSGANPRISKGYDGTGNSNHGTRASPNQPLLVLSGGPNGQPYISSDANSVGLQLPNITYPTGVVTFSIVAQRTTVGTASATYLGTQSGGNRIQSGNATANQWRLRSSTGSFTATASDNAWHSGCGIINGASSLIRVDSTETTGSRTGDTGLLIQWFGLADTGGDRIQMGEGLIYIDTALNATQRANLQANQKTYYGTP